MRTPSAADAPVDSVAIDIMGPNSRTERENHCFLDKLDYFTECFAIPDQEAETIADS